MVSYEPLHPTHFAPLVQLVAKSLQNARLERRKFHVHHTYNGTQTSESQLAKTSPMICYNIHYTDQCPV